MADLTHGGFVLATSQTGSLSVSWSYPDADTTPGELHLWILLTDPRHLDPGALHPERLLAELIRVPLEPTATTAVAYVPVGRPLGVLLMARNAAGDIVEAPPLKVESGAALTKRTPAPSPSQAATTPAPGSTTTTGNTTYRSALPPSAVPSGPSSGGPTRPAAALQDRPTVVSSQRIPLVFARPGSGTATFGSHNALGPDPALAGPPAFAALRERVQALTALAPRVNPDTPDPLEPVGGFGVQQRWTLTRLAFPPATGRERRLVFQTTFIGKSDLNAWRFDPPGWALPVPPTCDGLVDGLSTEDQTVFYALIERTDNGWVPLSLTPSAPPFGDIATPLLIGDPVSRLAAHTPPSESTAYAELHAQALSSLAHGLPPHREPTA